MRNCARMSYRDFVRLANDDGTLLINSPVDGPPSSEFNSTLNVSLSCVTALIRGTRDSSDTRSCVSAMFDLLVVRGVEVSFWPFSMRFPWESPSDGDDLLLDGANATPGNAANALGGRSGEPHFARHTDDDGNTSLMTFYLIDWLALLFLILFFSAVAGVCLSSGTTVERVLVVAEPPAARKAVPRPEQQTTPLLVAPSEA